MAIQFNDTTNLNGQVQFYEANIGANYGDVSGSTTKLKEFTARVKIALDNYLYIWAKNAGTWQADDINHSDFQIITHDVESGRRDYSFITDSGGNRIIDVSKVVILSSATATTYTEVNPIDELRTSASDILLNTNQGVPNQYGKIGNAVITDPIPNYSATNGIKMVVNREGSYPVYTDTTKIIGVPAYPEYFYLKAAFEEAKIKGLPNLKELEKQVIDLEGSERLGVKGKIADFFSGRERDVRKIMTPKKINFI